MFDEPELVQIDDVKVVKLTKRAILCEIENKKYWIPASVIVDQSEIGYGNEPGDVGFMIVPEWFAEKENLPYY
jgi:hypothetical protein